MGLDILTMTMYIILNIILRCDCDCYHVRCLPEFCFNGTFSPARASLLKNSRFKTFEEYLDSLVIEEDQKFLKDVDTARVIAQLGYRFDMVTLNYDLIPQV